MTRQSRLLRRRTLWVCTVLQVCTVLPPLAGCSQRAGQHVPPPAQAAATEPDRTDYLLRDWQHLYLSPGGEGPPGVEGRMLRLKYWNLPRTVRPGQELKSRIVWETVSGNPNAVVFATVFGDWDPDLPIRQLYRGYLGQPGKQFEAEFRFRAPDRPGRYRIRWLFPMAFRPIRSFYSQEDHGADDPGGAWWSEADFHVTSQ